jgi:hypothetical protein
MLSSCFDVISEKNQTGLTVGAQTNEPMIKCAFQDSNSFTFIISLEIHSNF